ncbi:MFS transporter [Streptoalloteichus hindustanus]|uniref:Major Facilitator Superfamily protein n=1 Tax=Streptoalloteichus hindustanus TaxID=2017 RepID=A0A1M4XL79_STRHI|nr:MFS transporter [Streptoalloteichus hindustanus]SHE94176.1 hypothetical protein SAMN05444320_10239 [Streptoalloteichus hindustanus]
MKRTSARGSTRCARALCGELRAGVVVFGAGSVVAGLTSDADLFAAARSAQGVGAVLAVSALVQAVRTDPVRQARVTTAWGRMSQPGNSSANPLPGAVVPVASWQWAFLLPAVAAGVAWAVAPRLLDPAPRRCRGQCAPGRALVLVLVPLVDRSGVRLLLAVALTATTTARPPGRRSPAGAVLPWSGGPIVVAAILPWPPPVSASRALTGRRPSGLGFPHAVPPAHRGDAARRLVSTGERRALVPSWVTVPSLPGA